METTVRYLLKNLVNDLTPKTTKSTRTIEFPDFVIEKLKGRKGKLIHMNPDTITHRFCEVRQKLDIPRFRFHDLRHYLHPSCTLSECQISTSFSAAAGPIPELCARSIGMLLIWKQPSKIKRLINTFQR